MQVGHFRIQKQRAARGLRVAREADEALAEIGLDDAAEPLPESSETDENASDAATAEPTAEPKAEPTTPTAEPKAESKAASGAKAAGSKYDDAKDDRGAKYDGAKADSKEAPETDNVDAIAAGDPVYGALIKMLDAAQRGDHATVAIILREADPAARRKLAGSRARVGSSFTSSTPLELAAAAHEEGEEAAVECCALLLKHTCASKDALAAARRVGNDAVVALLETAPPPQDEPQDEKPPQDAPPPAPKAAAEPAASDSLERCARWLREQPATAVRLPFGDCRLAAVFDGHCGGDPTCQLFGFHQDGEPTKMMADSLLYNLVQHQIKPGVSVDPSRFAPRETGPRGCKRGQMPVGEQW